MSDYVPTIGLEIHAELKTKTKMFCSSRNDADETQPNVHICPVCLAHPGTLPVINRDAVRHVLRVGVALHGTLADYTEFDRKNYFYPDLPKGYQISQYKYPLVSGGELSGVAITRVHLEEDTASSIHDEKTGETLIDYNRSGVPLMELVTEPVIHSAKQAGDFGRELQLLLRSLDASDADMEKGHMRLEANISVSNSETLGTKVEVKNINSFRAMERAVEYEIKRQSALLAAGKEIVQETRGWDEGKQETFSQRIKEVAADYRYFPDPDLPSLKLSEIEEFSTDEVKKTLPVLPEARRAHYRGLGLASVDAEQYVQDTSLGTFFDAVVTELNNTDLIKLASNYISNDLVNVISSAAKSREHGRDTDERDTGIKHEIPISVAHFSKLIRMIGERKISSRVAKDLLTHVIEDGKDPETIAAERGLLITTSADDLDAVVADVLAKNPVVVADYKGGKEAALQFLIGQGMKQLKGAVDPAELKTALVKRISK